MPVVAGPGTSSMANDAPGGTVVATFEASDPSGAPYPADATLSWGVVPATEADEVVAQALAFAEGTGRLEVVRPLAPGTYRARVYADVNATVSQLHDVEIVVE
jgi:hypothetical protein